MAVENVNTNQRLSEFAARLDPVVLLQASWVGHIPFWLNIIFIVLLAKFVAHFTWLIFLPEVEYKVINSAPVKQVNQSKARLQSVSRLHLFGQSQGKPAVSTARITKTSLRLVLKGVFASSNPLQAFAIVAENKNGKGRTYKVGERLPGGAVLHEVRSKEVILNRNGRLESLALPEQKLNTIPVTRHGRFAKPSRRSVRTLPATNRLRKLRDTFVRSPQKFMENARLEPVINRADGSTEGFTFNHNDPTVMRSLGLLPGDVITAINGTLITANVSAAYEQLLSSLKNGTPLSIDYKRKGVPQTVNVQM